MKEAAVFPGQGSQKVGMGKSLSDSFPVAHDTFKEADDTLGMNLSELMFNGPDDALLLTKNTQPALLALSIAIIRVIERELGEGSLMGRLTFVAGHSLGEYTALCATGTFTFPDAIKLVKARGEAMQIAVPIGEGSMAAILGLDLQEVDGIAIEASDEGICNFANDNAPGQVVLSGSKGAVSFAVELAKKKGAKRVVILPVSAPFHSNLMSPAAEVMREALENTEMFSPSIPLVSNITALPVTNVEEIRTQLVDQVCGRVRWRESILYMKEQGIGQVLEIGYGKVLSGMIRRIDESIITKNLGDPLEIKELIGEISKTELGKMNV